MGHSERILHDGMHGLLQVVYICHLGFCVMMLAVGLSLLLPASLLNSRPLQQAVAASNARWISGFRRTLLSSAGFRLQVIA